MAPLLLAAALAAQPAQIAAPIQGALPDAHGEPAARPGPVTVNGPPTSRPKGPSGPSGPPGLRSDKPVRVDADEVRFSWKTRQVTVTGKPFVTLLHDDATLTCRKLVGENDQAGRLRVATCTGDVKLVRGPRTVTCEQAVYDRDAARVVCTGKPVLRDAGGTEASGTSLTWDLGADEVRLEGAAQVTVPGGQLDLEPSPGGTRRPAPAAAQPGQPAQPAAKPTAPPAQPATKPTAPPPRPAGGGP